MRLVMRRWKVTVKIQDDYRKEDRIKSVVSHLECAYYFITHFS